MREPYRLRTSAGQMPQRQPDKRQMTVIQPTRTPARRRLTISSKIAAVVAVGISIGFLIVISDQIKRSNSLLYDNEQERNAYTTQLMALQIFDAVRWQKPTIVERAFERVIRQTGLGVDAAAAFDREGNLLAMRQADMTIPIDLANALHAEKAKPGNDGILSFSAGDHYIIIAPIVSSQGQNRQGTIAVAWNLAGLDAISSEAMIRQAIIAVATLTIFLLGSLIFVHRHLGSPLADITAATNRIANGDKSFPVPWTNRQDEIGDMARSLVTFRENVALIDRLTAEQQQQTMRLSKALDKEREYNALHRDFVSMVSHEFRTPVAIIDGAAQRISRRAGKDTPEQLQERVAKIRGAVNRIIELIDSTLSVSRLEAGAIALQVGDCDIGALLREVCQRQNEIAENHDIRLTIANLPPGIKIDAKRMDQVFTNLLSNAVKYAPDRPKIDVKAGIVGDKVVISVRDHGIGIPKGELPRLFEKFFRASTSTGIPGTGIGLHLVKHLVDLHQGSVTVDSIEGESTTVSVSLPIHGLVQPAPPGAADEHLRKNVPA